MGKLKADAIRDKIDDLHIRFLKQCGYSTDRQERNNGRLTNKTAFILNMNEKKHLEDVESGRYGDDPIIALESLIYDKETLFSDDFAEYNLNHEFFSQIRKKPV